MKKRMQAVLAGRGRPPAEEAAPPRPTPVAEPWEAGGVRFGNRLVQAPLAGIANWAFRSQSRRHGAGLTVSEMIASFGIRYANRKTLGMLTIVPGEHPVSVQIFGTGQPMLTSIRSAPACSTARAASAIASASAPKTCTETGCSPGTMVSIPSVLRLA